MPSYTNIKDLTDSVMMVRAIIKNNDVDDIKDIDGIVYVKTSPFIMFCISRDLTEMQSSYKGKTDEWYIVAEYKRNEASTIRFYSYMDHEEYKKLVGKIIRHAENMGKAMVIHDKTPEGEMNK